MEVWKKVFDFDYQVSSHGRIKNNKTGYISSGFKNKDGYYKTDFYVNGVKHRFAVHRLVAEAFLDAPTQDQLDWAATTKAGVVHVNHIDSNRGNNNYNNLEWTTASVNVKHSYTHGSAVPILAGAKITMEIANTIRDDWKESNKSIIEFARLNENKYSIGRKSIRRILYNQTWVN